MMVKVCKENKVRILEGFSFRFHPQHQKIIQLISNGTIGNIQTFSGTFGFPNPDSKDIRWSKELGGGILNDAGCYPIYASRMIFFSEPVGVFANMEFNPTKLIDTKIDAVLIFPQNKVAHITAGYNSYFQSKYKIWGTKGIISSNRAFSVSPNSVTTIDLERDDKVLTMEINPADQFSLMIDSFCSNISEEKSTFNFEEDLLSQAKILEAIRLSDKEKRFVNLD